MTNIERWTSLALDLMRTGLDIFHTSSVPVTEKGYADEKFLTLALLARTTSNFRSALLLLEHRRVIEARVLARCCLESSYWVAGIAAEGEKFARDMFGDDMHHRRRRGQRLFGQGLSLEDDVKEKLAAWVRDNRRFKDAKQLTPRRSTSLNVKLLLPPRQSRGSLAYARTYSAPRCARRLGAQSSGPVAAARELHRQPCQSRSSRS